MTVWTDSGRSCVDRRHSIINGAHQFRLTTIPCETSISDMPGQPEYVRTCLVGLSRNFAADQYSRGAFEDLAAAGLSSEVHRAAHQVSVEVFSSAAPSLHLLLMQ